MDREGWTGTPVCSTFPRHFFIAIVTSGLCC
jgi:hypothetical protein